ncbi:MAG: aminoglycoside 6-adenylyltransferase [Armatimonadetes bacterium]|nr:aminoglycoside 6-adenylyltransferase [Armatimonadota bacterium]
MEALRIEGPEPQSRLINSLADALARDERIQACWLRGSFARGASDRYSDIDFAVAVDDEEFHHGFQSAKQIASEAGECVIAWDSPKDVNGAGFTAFYADCNFLDVKVYRSSRVSSLPASDPVLPIFDRRGLLDQPRTVGQPEDSLAPPVGDTVQWKMTFFWICVYSAVRFIKREEFWYAAGMINAVRGTLAQAFWLWNHPDDVTDMSFLVWGVVRRDLDPALIAELNATVPDSERREMAGVLGGLIEMMERHGKRIASDTGAEYPGALAHVVSGYYRAECGA